MASGMPAENVLELCFQGRINLGHGRMNAKSGQAGDAVTAYAAGHDARKVGEIGGHIKRDPVIGDPASNAYADSGNLVLCAIRSNNPDSHAAIAPLALHTETRERADQPVLEIANEATHVSLATAKIDQHVGDALPRSVVGELSAAAGLENRKTRLQQIRWIGACPSRIDGRMFKQPDEFARAVFSDLRHAALHESDRLQIIDQPFRYAPRNRCYSSLMVSARGIHGAENMDFGGSNPPSLERASQGEGDLLDRFGRGRGGTVDALA